MEKRHLLIAGILFLLIHQFVFPASVTFQLYFFFIGIAILGIPHGAADMLVANQVASIKNLRFSKYNFLGKYLLRLGAFVLLFFYLPVPALILFLLLAAYHFGETDLSHFNTSSVAGKLFAISYGLLILSVILLTHFDEILPLLYQLSEDGFKSSSIDYIKMYSYQIISFFLFLFFAFSFIYFYIVERNNYQSGSFLVQLVVLLIILFYLPLLLGFTFYFVIWHSFLSLKNIISFLKKSQNISGVLILKQMVIYSLLAIGGMLLLGWGTTMFVSYDLLILYVFIGLAVLTLPHMQVMYQMYSSIRTGKSKK